MTGMDPPDGVGRFIAGSTGGGQMTPFELASLSLSVLSRAGSVLVSISLPCPIVAFAQGSGLFCAGLAGALVCGGACAEAAVASKQASPKSISRFIALIPLRGLHAS